MEHLGTICLETDRLILRPFTMDDAEAMYKNWASDDQVTKYLTWPAHKDVTVTRGVLADWTGNYGKKDYYQWAIVMKDQGDRPIGSIGVNVHDDRLKMAHVGYCIGRKWWRRAVTSEALQCVLDFLFDQVGMNRVESRHDPRNANSGKVMEKCGMKYEGTLREADRNNQGICDASYYGLLAKERSK